MPRPDLADVGDGIAVGTCGACDRLGATFDRVVHVWKPQNVAAGLTCRHVLGREPGGLAVEWREDQGIADLRPGIAAVADYAAGPGRLLVHCLAGSCRSTALALVAKIARGCDPFDAARDVVRGVYRDRGFMVGWRRETIEEVFAWAAELERVAANY